VILLRPLRTLLAAIRRFFSRRAAQRLLAQQLPKGLLPAPERTFRIALRVPIALDDAPPGEFWTLPLGAHAIRGRRPARLLRLAALPKPPQRLDVLRPHEVRVLLSRVRVPELLELVPPLQSRVRQLAIARPRSLRLDAELRLPSEIDPLRLPSDAPPPVRERRFRPRTPLPRAPVHRLRPRNFRLDARTGQPANQGILPLETRDTTGRWVLPAFRREKVDLPWMAQERISFLGPLQYEWFLMWWDAYQKRRPGGREPYDYVQPEELYFALEAVKEQMLIRRDVKKDESPPEKQEFGYIEFGLPIAALDTPPLNELVPPKPWVGRAAQLEPLPLDRAVREAYLQWRTLVDALEER
jgi:hypothetical protein